MLLTNSQMHAYMDTLQTLMDNKGILGYAILKNYNTFKDACKEYLQIYQNALVAYGDKTTEETAAGTQEYMSISPASEHIEEFVAEMEPVSNVMQDVQIYTVGYSKAMDVLSASEMQSISFMLEDDLMTINNVSETEKE